MSDRTGTGMTFILGIADVAKSLRAGEREVDRERKESMRPGSRSGSGSHQGSSEGLLTVRHVPHFMMLFRSLDLILSPSQGLVRKW